MLSALSTQQIVRDALSEATKGAEEGSAAAGVLQQFEGRMGEGLSAQAAVARIDTMASCYKRELLSQFMPQAQQQQGRSCAPRSFPRHLQQMENSLPFAWCNGNHRL